MLDKILKSLSPERISEILMRLPEDSLYLKYVNQLVKDASLDNKSYAALIGLGNNMNEFYQIKHQSKEMVENILFQLIQWENTAENRTLKYSVLSKYYFAKANHDLGKTYLKKVVAQEHNDAFLGYQLDLMNGLFLDLTNNYSRKT